MMPKFSHSLQLVQIELSPHITCPTAAATQNILLGKVRWGLSASADESAISGSSEGLTLGGSRLRQLLLRAEVETDSNMKVGQAFRYQGLGRCSVYHSSSRVVKFCILGVCPLGHAGADSSEECILIDYGMPGWRIAWTGLNSIVLSAFKRR